MHRRLVDEPRQERTQLPQWWSLIAVLILGLVPILVSGGILGVRCEVLAGANVNSSVCAKRTYLAELMLLLEMTVLMGWVIGRLIGGMADRALTR